MNRKEEIVKVQSKNEIEWQHEKPADSSRMYGVRWDISQVLLEEVRSFKDICLIASFLPSNFHVNLYELA